MEGKWEGDTHQAWMGWQQGLEWVEEWKVASHWEVGWMRWKALQEKRQDLQWKKTRRLENGRIQKKMIEKAHLK